MALARTQAAAHVGAMRKAEDAASGIIWPVKRHRIFGGEH